LVFTCPICGRRFATKAGLEFHMAYTLCGGGQVYICPRCGARFLNARRALRHARLTCRVKHVIASGAWGTYPLSLEELEREQHHVVDQALHLFLRG